MNFRQKMPNILPVKGGRIAKTSCGTSARTTLGALTLPPWAKAVVGYKAVLMIDGAVTDSEEGSGAIEFNWKHPRQGAEQMYPLTSSHQPNLGTEVEGADIHVFPYFPVYIPNPTPGQSWTIQAYGHLYSPTVANGRLVHGVVYI